VIGKTIAEIAPGDAARITRAVTPTDVAHFVDAVGDYNPVHSDPVYAATSVFREPIAPGIFTAGLISAVIGTELPGPGAIYLSQSLKFVKPVLFGDTITARVEVAEVIRERNRLRLITSCTNQRDEEVLSGEAWVMPSRTSIVYEGGQGRAVAPLATLAVQPWTWAAQVVGFWGALGLAMLGIGEGRASGGAVT
jgi:3-hydroxybutyryl-CoA dehydratase